MPQQIRPDPPPLPIIRRLIPLDGLFALPAGTAAHIPLVIRCTSPGMGDRVLEVLCRRGDVAIASAYLSFLHNEGAVQRHPYRGFVCEVHPDRSQMRTAIRFEPVGLPDAWRVGMRTSAGRPGREHRQGQPRGAPEEDALERRHHRRRHQSPRS